SGAQNNLAVMYYHGQGVQKDIESAIQLWRKAAANGEQAARDNLANLGIYDY
ncbi:MAG: SEL1-like repeat protein, partial [Synergistaceae bacterium]|nr:SEL1-like repeat protein [Synergistaceae bacterium]